MVEAATGSGRFDDRVVGLGDHCFVVDVMGRPGGRFPGRTLSARRVLSGGVEDDSVAARVCVHGDVVCVDLLLRAGYQGPEVEVVDAGVSNWCRVVAARLTRFQALPALLQLLQRDVWIFGRGYRVDALALLHWRVDIDRQ